MFDFDAVIDLLRADGSVVVNKNLARNIGLDCAVLYSELASKYKYFKNKGQLTEDGFFFNTVDNLCYDTCLSDFQQREGIKKLIALGLVDKCVKGLPAKRYFKVVPDVEKLQKYLQHQEIQQFLINSKTRNKLNKKLDIEKLNGNNTKLNNTKKIINNNVMHHDLNNDVARAVDNFSDDGQIVYDYFIDKYFIATGSKHPSINQSVVDKINSIFEDEYITDPESNRELSINVGAMCDMIDWYFDNNNPLYGDRKIYHFLSPMILKNLYNKVAR